jgi:peptidoglycan/LPS O-acetylase OafA/YrhL
LTAARRYEALDGCRGIAACLVALYHFRSVFQVRVQSHIGELPIVHNAWLGVEFFFVLSGFVIAANYQERLTDGSIRLRDFVVLRLGRLYPMHLMSLLAMAIVVLVLMNGPTEVARPDLPAGQLSVPAFIANVLMVHGLHVGPTIMWNQWNHPSWSISAELATYLIFAVSWRLLHRLSWLVVGSAILLIPPALLIVHGGLDVTFDWGLLRSVLGFSLGIVAFKSARLRSVETVFSRLTYREATIAEIVLAAATVGFVSIAGDSPISLAGPFLFTGVVLLYSYERGAIASALSSTPVGALGRWSYSIYMLHYPLQVVLVYVLILVSTYGMPELFALGGDPARPQLVLGSTAWFGDLLNVLMLTALIATSALTYRMIEKPWRERVRGIVYGT